ncbi:MAG: hypothetical protein QOC82_2040, partial [Frankiaceae bacterium]|nr:hypothetical protein [Frankiaceae bacterium]
MVDDSTTDTPQPPAAEPAAPAKKATARKRTTKAVPEVETSGGANDAAGASGAETPAPRTARKRTAKKAAATAAPSSETLSGDSGAKTPKNVSLDEGGAPAIPTVIFKAPEPVEPDAAGAAAPPRKRAPRKATAPSRPRTNAAETGEAESGGADGGETGADTDLEP